MVEVVGVCGHDVADEDLGAGRGRLDGGGGSGDPVETLEGRVDLAQLDPTTPELHLLVRAADEDESLGVVDHEVAGPVGALPAEARHGRELLGVLDRVEVASETDPADDELAHLPRPDGLFVGVDDDEVPAVERQADAHGAAPVEHRAAGHDGGLGRAVGVPDLTLGGREPFGELGRAGLPAEDEQPHLLERLGGPEGGEGRHGRDDRDALSDEPGPEVDPGPHERAGGRHKTSAVAPREPHLLTRRVEGDRQTGEDAVARADRLALDEHSRLGVDEGGGRPVGHGDALGYARRSGREDHPGIVVRGHLRDHVRGQARGRARRADAGRPGAGTSGNGADRAAGADDRRHPSLPEDEVGALLRVVRIDGHVGRPGAHDAEDAHVEVMGAGGCPDAHGVPATDPVGRELAGHPVDVFAELGIGQDAAGVVDGRGVRMCSDRRVEDVEKRPRGRRPSARQQRIGQAALLHHEASSHGHVERV